MLCSCGVVNAPSAKFCGACGNGFKDSSSQPSSSCPACHESLKANAKFCGKCGHQTSPKAEIKPPQAQRSEDVTPSSKHQVSSRFIFPQDRKKLVGITAAGAILVSVAIGSWYALNDTSKSAEAVNGSEEIAPAIAAANEATSSQKSVPPTSPYIGQIIRDGSKIGKDYVGKFDQKGQFTLLTVWDEDGASKMVLVTDPSGTVIEAKSVTKPDRYLVHGADQCFHKNQPVSGIYALATLNSASTPTDIWKLSNEGKLLEQPTAGIQCVAYLDEDYEDVPIPAEPLPKASESSVKKPLSAPVKNAKPKQEPVTITPASQTNEVEPAPPAQTSSEPVPTAQPATTNQELSQKKGSSLNDLFGKLGESIKKGATERTCSDAERSLGQCK